MNKLWCNNYKFTPVAKWCLEEILKMEDYYVNVNFCVFLQWGKHGEFIPPDSIHISQDLKFPENLRALFHEIRHYYQFKKGIYDFIPENYNYDYPPDADEQAKRIIRYYSYLNYPWELDANEFATETMRQFWKSPNVRNLQYP